jgi:hypothetical protein
MLLKFFDFPTVRTYVIGPGTNGIFVQSFALIMDQNINVVIT